MNDDDKKFDPYKPVVRETQEVVFNPEFYRAAIEAGFLPKRVSGGVASTTVATDNWYFSEIGHYPVVPLYPQNDARWHFVMSIGTAYPSEESTVNTETNSPTDIVQNHIDLVTDDLQQGRTTPDQRRGLKGAVERADRVAPASDQAFGRIVGKP